jgi:SAM-dependent methyltransferase
MKPEDSLDREQHDYTSAMLLRSGVNSMFLDRYFSPGEPLLPPDASAYLRDSNSRLIELTKQYTSFSNDCIQHSQWNEKYVAQDIPLWAFRGDCGFVWQQRDFNLPVNYILTYQYLLANGQADLLRLLTEDELFGVYAIKSGTGWITRDRLDSVSELWFLERHLNISRHTKLHILDIGAGYGRFAHRLLQAYDTARVSCVDAIARSTFLCEYYLSFRDVQRRSRVIPLPYVESNSDLATADLAVNIHSFSECPITAIRWWLVLLKSWRVRHLMIVPNQDQHRGTRLLSKELNGTRCDFRKEIENAGYRLVVAEPKYLDPSVHDFGITPTHYFLFQLRTGR